MPISAIIATTRSRRLLRDARAIVTETLAAAWTGVLIALCGVATAVLGVLAVHLPRLVQTWVDKWREQIATSRTDRVERASDRAVAAAEEVARMAPLDGPAKLSLASDAAREEYGAPVPLAAIQASVAKLRTAQRSASIAPVQLPLGAALSIPLQVVSSSSAPPEHEPPPIPRPAPTGFRGGGR